MSDKGEQKEKEKPTEPKVPDIEVTPDVATTGTETADNDDGKKSSFGAFAGMVGKGFNLIGAKRSKSKSPESKTQMGGESSKGSSKLAKSSSPSKRLGRLVQGWFNPKGSDPKGEEGENLCEEEVKPHSDKQYLAPPEPDQGVSVGTSTDTETMEDKCESYDKSSSVSSAPSDYSSLLHDDGDTDNVTSPDDLNSPDDGEQNEKLTGNKLP